MKKNKGDNDMDSKIIISSLLTDFTLSSKTKFIEAKGNEDLMKLAKSKGIDLPSPDLACFETYYCELDCPNLNNAMLTKQAAEEGINSLVGKQINLNHQGKNYIMGYTIDAKIKDSMIITTGILFKSLFAEEFEEIEKLFEEGKLFVSFELWNTNPENGESIIEVSPNGVKKIIKMIAHGVGLLLRGVNPACKKAKVFKLLANQKDNGEKIFQKDDRFSHASLSDKVVKCTNCTICTCNKEEKTVEISKEIENLVIQNAELAVIAVEPVVTETAKEVLCPECHQSMKEDETELCAVCKTKKDEKHQEAIEVKEEAVTTTEIVPAETKAEVIAPAAETQTEIITDVVTSTSDATTVTVEVPQAAEEAAVTTTTQLVTEVVTTVDNTTTVETDSIVIRDSVSDDGSKSTQIQETKQVNTYTFEQVQEEIAKVKVELEQKLLEKDNELASLKELIEKTKVEKETEIANLKTELETTKKPIEIAKVESIELTVGKVTEVVTDDKYVALRKSIDIKAFGKKG